MKRHVRKLFIPHEVNAYHPHATRHHALLLYALVFMLAHYLLFPILGIHDTKVAASDLQVQEIIDLVNEERKEAGAREVRNNPQLVGAALAKGENMLNEQYWSHFGPNGETPWQFIKAAGYEYVYAGENLAKDFSESLNVHRAWMNSPTHRENILNPHFTEIGVAILNGSLLGKETTLIVQMFASSVQRLQYAGAMPDNNAPIISQPLDGQYFPENSVEVRGTADHGNTIKVYSNGQVIAVLPKEGAAFTVNAMLFNDRNELIVKSLDETTGTDSEPSKTITVTIDKKPPDTDKIFVGVRPHISHWEVLSSSTEELRKVVLSQGAFQQELRVEDNIFSAKFNKDELKDDIFTLEYYDAAGNSSMETYSIASLLGSADFSILGTTENGGPINLEQHIKGASSWNIRSIFDIVFVLGLITVLTVDVVFIVRKGVRRHTGSHYGLNVGMIIIVVFAVLIL